MTDPTLIDGQWHLAYDAYKNLAAASVVFGRVFTDGVFLTQDVDVQWADSVLGDVSAALEDGIRFGRDYAQGSTLTFQLGVETWDDPAKMDSNAAAVAAIRAAWNGRALRAQPNAVSTLRYCLGTRQRRVYGRPRQFAPTNNALAKQGFTAAVASFQTIDGLFYDDTEQTFWVDKAASDAPGFIAPIVTPLTTISMSTQEGQFVVGGTAPTAPLITLYGPIVQPVIEVVGLFKIGLDLTLTAGQVVTIDPRPWARTVLRDDGANLAGTLTSVSSRMKDMAVPPGTWAARLSGQDATGTSRAKFAWRNAYDYL